MRKMKSLPFGVLMLGMLVSVAVGQIEIETVFVGNAGNDPQSSSNRHHSLGGGDGLGQVNYDYHIGTYAVTNAQYVEFLNAVAATDTHGLYNAFMGSSEQGGISRSGSPGSYTYSVRTATTGFNQGQSMADMPVNFVSFWDAARFANWLTNGQPTGAQGAGTTETGVYNLDGVTNPTNDTITRDATAWANGGVAVASIDEWYKAAYYDPVTGYYSLYATGSDSVPTATTPNDTDANSANYWGSLSPANSTVTPGGGYELASSFYGTFDQSGNVLEWNDFIDGSNRQQRGGAYAYGDVSMQSWSLFTDDPTNEYAWVGFRVTSLIEIPEPTTYAVILGVLGVLLVVYRRRRGGD